MVLQNDIDRNHMKETECRINKLQFTKLEIRRQRGDLIQYYKLVKGLMVKRTENTHTG